MRAELLPRDCWPQLNTNFNQFIGNVNSSMLIANPTRWQGNMSSPDTNKDGPTDPHKTISLLSIILLSLLILVIIIKGAVQVEVNRFMGEKFWMKKVKVQIRTILLFNAIIVCRRSPATLGSAEVDFNMTKFVIKMTILCEIII